VVTIFQRAALAAVFTCLGLLGASVSLAEEDRWQEMLERIASGVVSIKVDGTRAFDTNWNQSTQATGFVVDADRGLILTNRHVVTPGPVVAEAVFVNHEEIPVYPVYRDPVHDFGIYRYDPDSLRFIQPAELPLYPEGARLGTEIRVVGNDAGEQLSILAGTLARLDRKSPDYGRGNYNDFNTFYFQAASGTSGGSSGSPVVNVEGRVVALNAGANTNAASSFFLPLDRVRRALEKLQQGEPVPRGTLLTEFVHASYDELRRLGLDAESESAIRQRFPQATGMLVVERVVPGSPVTGQLEPGDILLRVDGDLVTGFVPLEEVLDNRVGGVVALQVQRGGRTLDLEVVPADLHAVTPADYVEFGDAVAHQLSYQQARHLNVSPEGIYLANPGYVFARSGIPRAAVITELNGVTVATLEDFRGLIEALEDGEQFTVRYYTFDDPRGSRLRTVRMDRRWYPANHCRRDDSLGVWPCEPLAPVGSAAPPEAATTRFIEYDDRRRDRLAASLVMVNFDMPYPVAGVSERHYHGTGVVIDAQRGLVVVDRNTVPVSLGDVRVTFAGSLEIPGRVEWIHPLHNLAVVAYDPELVGETQVRSARFNLDPVEPGDKLWVVGLKGDHSLVVQSTEVASIDPVSFPLSRTLRFRDTNLETLSLVNAPTEFDGVLTDADGKVVSLWSSFAYHAGQDLEQVNKGVPADIVAEVIDHVGAGRPIRSLEAEFVRLPLSSARGLGLPADWIAQLEDDDPRRRQALQVLRVVAGTPAADVLSPGDLLLAIDGEVVTSFREVEKRSQAEEVEVLIWRDGAQQAHRLRTVALDGRDVDRLLVWAGALLHAPHRAMAAQRGIEPYGVYVAYFGYGSPATRYGLYAGRRIVQVDGIDTPDLDAFLEAVRGRGDREAVRLKTVMWNGSVEVITLKLDNRYWPTYELIRNGAGWSSRSIDSPC
jgi:S1-C subfamily serine protease